jgi:hypothetical protein
MLIRRRRANNRPTASATNNATAMATEIQITLDTRTSWHPGALVSSAGRSPVPQKPPSRYSCGRFGAWRSCAPSAHARAREGDQGPPASAALKGRRVLADVCLRFRWGVAVPVAACQISESSQLASVGISSGNGGWPRPRGSGSGSMIGGDRRW